MSHIDFVLWVVGWAFLMGMQDKERTVGNGIRNLILTIIWIAIAVLIY